MPRNKPILFPKSSRILIEFGENIRLARLRRNFSAAQVAERANISRPTLTALETGAPGVSIGPVSYTHLRAHETVLDLVCRLLLEKKKQKLTTALL